MKYRFKLYFTEDSACTFTYGCRKVHPPVKVVVVVLCLSPEVEEQQRQTKSYNQQGEGGSFQLLASENKHVSLVVWTC
ncbi:hypothetical protein XENORESO_013612 [Xenotaenia resolanae]|uniref:Uncharacterized protein n=1 Tax=Xenotaenia resolanae TaxID=208358 RepID=A0ABV0WX71_9TELE